MKHEVISNTNISLPILFELSTPLPLPVSKLEMRAAERLEGNNLDFTHRYEIRKIKTIVP
jgi:hypothetical protein